MFKILFTQSTDEIELTRGDDDDLEDAQVQNVPTNQQQCEDHLERSDDNGNTMFTSTKKSLSHRSKYVAMLDLS